MLRRACFAIVILLAALAVKTSTAPAKSTPASLDAALKAAVERTHVPGVVAMAADRHRIIYQSTLGLADVANRQPMAADTIFRIASMTKPITSVAAMQLIEQRRIALDDPAEKYLPELATVPVFESFDAATGAYKLRPATKKITVRQLFTHTTGLGMTLTSPIIRDFKPREGETYPVGPLLFEPGERWHYGSSTDLLGRLVEAVSGKPLDAYFRDHIFVPLKMNDTFFNIPEEKQARLATLHRQRPDGSLGEQPRQPIRPVTRFNGAGGLSSTAGDYIRFLRMLLNDGEFEGARILSAESVRTMALNHIGDIGVPAMRSAMPETSKDFSFIADGRDKFGLGFLINVDSVPGKRAVRSLSWAGVDNTYFWIDRTSGVVAVVMMQFLPFADPRALEVHDVFERGVYQLARP